MNQFTPEQSLVSQPKTHPTFSNQHLIVPAAFDHVKERELLGGLDGVGGDGEGG